MNEKIQKLYEYLTDRMDQNERAEFEALANDHPNVQRKVDVQRPIVNYFRDVSESLENAELHLSPSRRAELRRDALFNIVDFPGSDDSGEQPGQDEDGWVRVQLSRWAAVAVVLVGGVIFSLAVSRDAGETDIVPNRTVAESTVALAAAQSGDQSYIFPPAYGLNRPEPWRFAYGRAVEAAVPASAIDQEYRLFEWTSVQAATFGLDGPRPYSEVLRSTVMGVI